MPPLYRTHHGRVSFLPPHSPMRKLAELYGVLPQTRSGHRIRQGVACHRPGSNNALLYVPVLRMALYPRHPEGVQPPVLDDAKKQVEEITIGSRDE